MSEEEIKDALLEARILEKLDHPNIIHFKESFIMKKPKLSLCIVMDYADGKF
jgi:NIMA (never in mitosis gene a)-related kinase